MVLGLYDLRINQSHDQSKEGGQLPSCQDDMIYDPKNELLVFYSGSNGCRVSMDVELFLKLYKMIIAWTIY